MNQSTHKTKKKYPAPSCHSLYINSLQWNPDFQDILIIETIGNEYNTNFDKGTLSEAIIVKVNDYEESIYKELSTI